jgi:hypothetical protein
LQQVEKRYIYFERVCVCRAIKKERKQKEKS